MPHHDQGVGLGAPTPSSAIGCEAGMPHIQLGAVLGLTGMFYTSLAPLTKGDREAGDLRQPRGPSERRPSLRARVHSWEKGVTT